jgi:exopolysaccharide biosynthesis predicted pyruvyltransferase EpsI
MLFPNDAYAEFLRRRSGRRVYLKPYVGNSGDGLIWMGSELLLRQLNLIQVVNPANAEIVLWPGGNPTMWPSNLRGWQECWRCWPEAEFVVGPGTFHESGIDWARMLRDAKSRIGGVFARDPASYENLRRAALPSHIAIGLGHDPAFCLRDSEWILQHRDANTSEYVLASFRDDHEAAPFDGPAARAFAEMLPHFIRRRIEPTLHRRSMERRLELVKRIAGSAQPLVVRDAPLVDFQSFVECVRRASQVHTDRLHCMILAVLLNKEVFAYPTAYGKLEAVYEHSMKSWARVEFVSSSADGVK